MHIAKEDTVPQDNDRFVGDSELPLAAANRVVTAAADGEFNLSDYQPKGTDDDWLLKTMLMVFALVVLLYPFIFLWFPWLFANLGGDSVEWKFGLGAAALIGANLLGVAMLALFKLQPLHERWSRSVEKIGKVDKTSACDGVRDTLHTFRHLLKWRRFVKFSRILFGYFYAIVVGYTVAVAFPDVLAQMTGWQLQDPFGLGPFAPWALTYYVAVTIVRYVVQVGILGFTDKLDPTYQICSALATLHERWQEAAGGRR